MSDRIVDLAAERARRRPIEIKPIADGGDTGEAISLMGLATSAWLVGWVKLWTAMWVPKAPLVR